MIVFNKDVHVINSRSDSNQAQKETLNEFN